MTKRNATMGALCAAALSLAASPAAPPPQELELSERNHKDLGKILQDFLERTGSPEQVKYRGKLQSELEKIGKRAAGKGEDPMQAVLSLTADLGRALFLAGDYENERGGRILKGEVQVPRSEQSFEYAVWLPPSYKSSAGPYPLLLCIPGTKDGKNVSPEQYLQEHWTEGTVRDAAVIAACEMPADIGLWTELTGGVSAIMLTFAELRRNYPLDPDRLYLVGREAGVQAALSLASKYPHLFAGVIGRSGDAGTVAWQNFKNLPTYLQGAGAGATAFCEALKEAGCDNCTVAPEAATDEIWAWIQEHTRVANPSEVTLAPGSPIPNKAYWVEVPPTESEDDLITAVADRESNTITITAQGVRSVTLYLNDVLVDLDRPLKVILNGQEGQYQIPRSLDDMLDLIVRGTSDAGKLYVARRSFDIPEGQ